jgi:tetratricopeptide (TPR) repeat protein
MSSQDDNQKSNTTKLRALLENFRRAIEAKAPQELNELTPKFFQLGKDKEMSKDLFYKKLAEQHEFAGRWEEAEKTYQLGLELAISNNNTHYIFKGYYDLSSLYSLLGKDNEALEAAIRGADFARQLGRNPTKPMAFRQLASLYIKHKESAKALDIIEEILRLPLKYGANEHQRASALILSAKCRLQIPDIDQALKDLDTSWSILAPFVAATALAGIQSSIANWWEVTSQVSRLLGDTAASVDSMQKAVDFRRTVSMAPQLNGPYKYAGLAAALKSYAEILTASGDLNAAKAAMAEAQEIRHSIHLP